MTDAAFRKLLASLGRGRSRSGNTVTVDADGQLRVLQDATTKAKFTCKQMLTIVKGFDFDQDRLASLKIIHPRLVDTDCVAEVLPFFEDGGYDQGLAKKFLGL